MSCRITNLLLGVPEGASSKKGVLRGTGEHLRYICLSLPLHNTLTDKLTCKTHLAGPTLSYQV